MILAYLLLLTGLTISSVAIYYSVVGLTAIFSAAAIPIMIMGVSLEVAKLVCATWIKQYWSQVPRLMKTYMVTAVTVLMLITSMGIFGFLSKAHNDQNLVSGDVGAKLAIYDEKIKTARDNIEADRKQLSQMDVAVDQVMSRSSDEKGADKANAIRNSQKRDRAALAKDIEANQTIISKLNDEAAPIRAENRKVEAEVGPIKYIAAFIYGTAPDASMLEKAVTWIIIMIVIVFDPLAVIMLLASQMTFGWHRKEVVDRHEAEELSVVDSDPTIDPPKKMFGGIAEQIEQRLKQRFKPKPIEVDDTPNYEGVRLPDGEWVQTGPAFAPLTEMQTLTAVEQQALDEALREELSTAETVTEPDSIGDIPVFEEREELPLAVEEPEEVKPAFSGFSIPLSTPYMQPKEPAEQIIENKPDSVIEEEPVLITRVAFPESNYNVSMDERPGDYVESPVEHLPNPRTNEAAPGPNRGVMYSFPIQADNTPNLGKAANSDFGNQYPENPEKGDVYLRTDFLPNRLFKFNGFKWIEVDKDSTDLYAYEEAYIQHLIEEIDAGRYDPDSLSDVEREQIADYLGRNAQ